MYASFLIFWFEQLATRKATTIYPQKNQPEAKQNSLVNRNNILIQISELVPATYVSIMQLLCFKLGKFTIDNQRNRAKLRN